MAKGFYISFKVPELNEALKDIAKYDTKTAMKIENQVSKSTKAIGRGARRKLVTNNSIDSGDLKKSIRTNFDVKKIQGTVSAKQYYAHFVEFGAKPAPSKNIPARPAKPFITPAFEAERQNLIRGITEAVKKP